jgi:hypothetical protein
MRTKFVLFTIAVAVAVVLAGCSKSSTTPNSPVTQNTAPSFPSVTVSGPTTTSTEAHAQLAVGYAAEVNAYSNSGLFGAFAGMNGTQNGNTWTWTITEGTLGVTFTETKQSDGSYTWSWVENGTDPSTKVTYSNWTFFSGNRTSDGKNGDWKVYKDNTTVVAADFSWTTNASGTPTGTVLGYTSGTLATKIAVVNNSDKSGEVDVYAGTVLTFKATWIASGAGSWWMYDSGTGTQTGTGTWT